MNAVSLPRGFAISWFPSRLDAYSFVMAVILVIGCLVRVSLTLSTDFTLHDGGLFYRMIENIRRSHYVLPHFTSFNGLEIPFAYPPLAFYAAAAISDATRLPALDVLRVLPSIIAGAVLLAFFVLARSVLTSRVSVAAAVLVFAALPSSFSYLIVGAGLASLPGCCLLSWHWSPPTDFSDARARRWPRLWPCWARSPSSATSRWRGSWRLASAHCSWPTDEAGRA